MQLIILTEDACFWYQSPNIGPNATDAPPVKFL